MNWQTTKFRSYKLWRLRTKGFLPALSKQEARKLIEELSIGVPVNRIETKKKRSRPISPIRTDTKVLPNSLHGDVIWKIYTLT